MSGKKPTCGVPPVERAFHLLRYIADDNTCANISRAAKDTSINPRPRCGVLANLMNPLNLSVFWPHRLPAASPVPGLNSPVKYQRLCNRLWKSLAGRYNCPGSCKSRSGNQHGRAVVCRSEYRKAQRPRRWPDIWANCTRVITPALVDFRSVIIWL